MNKSAAGTSSQAKFLSSEMHVKEREERRKLKEHKDELMKEWGF